MSIGEFQAARSSPDPPKLLHASWIIYFDQVPRLRKHVQIWAWETLMPINCTQ